MARFKSGSELDIFDGLSGQAKSGPTPSRPWAVFSESSMSKLASRNSAPLAKRASAPNLVQPPLKFKPLAAPLARIPPPCALAAPPRSNPPPPRRAGTALGATNKLPPLAPPPKFADGIAGASPAVEFEWSGDNEPTLEFEKGFAPQASASANVSEVMQPASGQTITTRIVLGGISRSVLWMLAGAASTVIVAAALGAVGLLRGSTGTLRIYVAGPEGREVQNVSVFVDDAKRCDATPCTVTKLQQGMRDVRVEAPLYQRLAARPVQVTAGELTTFSVELTQDKQNAVEAITTSQQDTPSPATGSDAQVRAATRQDDDQRQNTRVAEPRAELNARAPQRTHSVGNASPSPSRATPAEIPALDSAADGHLNINSIPAGAAVLIDGRPIGRTPRASLTLSPGSHTVTIIHPEKGRKTTSVEIKPGETRSVEGGV